jgi:hypothetical protein
MEPLEIVIAIILSVFVMASIVWLLFPLCRRRYMKRHLIAYFGKRIYHVALYNDFYLINQVRVPLDDANEAHIDHLLFGEKFIYVIKDRYYDGALTGKHRDTNWMFYPNLSRRGKYISNPFLINKVRIDKLALVTGLDPHLFINLIVVNEGCLLDDIVTNDESTYIVKLSKMEKLIKANESRDIPPINEAQLDVAVKDIYQLVKGRYRESGES